MIEAVRVANRRRVIRNKHRFRPALARGTAVNDENFFLAKMRDSESTTTRPQALARLTPPSLAPDAHQTRIEEIAAAQAFPANLTNADAGGVGIFRIAISTHWLVIAASAACALVMVHQHFLKQDAVFFDVLVYSE
jgi:hypothetical protein